jgi:hypothetical protein
MNKHIARLKQLVEGLPRVEAVGRQPLILKELGAVEGAFRYEKGALADAVHRYVIARERGASAEEKATLYRRVTEALGVLVQAVEHGKRS